MELTVLLLSIVNILLALFVLFGGRYVFRRMERLEESIHQINVRSLSAAPPAVDEPATIRDTGWNE